MFCFDIWFHKIILNLGLLRNTTKQWKYINGDPLTNGHILPGFIDSELDCIGIRYNGDEDRNSILPLNCYDLQQFMPICQVPKQTDLLGNTPKKQFGN